MATPRADSHSAASGAAVYAGRYRYPAWRRSLTLNTWAQIGGNVITDVNPADDLTINPNYPSTAPWAQASHLSGAADQWSGGAWDETACRFWFCGGGHSGYYGNEAYSIDLAVDTPAWRRRGYPSGSIQHPIASVTANGSDNSVMTDGRPHQTHTYNLLCIDGFGNLTMMPSGGTWEGHFAGIGHKFSHADDDWIGGLNFGASTGAAGCACYDPVRNLHWLLDASFIRSVDSAGATTERHNAWGDILGYYSHLVYDPLRDIVVIFRGGGSDSLWQGAGATQSVAFFDPDAPTTIYYAPQSVAQFSWGPQGISYDATADRYLVWNGTTMTAITPPATNPATNTWAHSPLSLTGTPSTPATYGTWGRFQVSEKYGCALLLNRTTERLWALRLH